MDTDARPPYRSPQMSNYRVEVVWDAVKGKYYAVLFHATESPIAIARTRAVYETEAEALRRADRAMRVAFGLATSSPSIREVNCRALEA